MMIVKSADDGIDFGWSLLLLSPIHFTSCLTLYIWFLLGYNFGCCSAFVVVVTLLLLLTIIMLRVFVVAGAARIAVH